MKLPLALLMLLLGIAQNPPVVEGTIQGRVLRAGTGEPIANMPVTLITSGGLSDDALATLLEQISQMVTVGLQGGGGGPTQDITVRQVAGALQSAGPGVGTQDSVLTDRDGHFAFTNIPRGRYTVWVQRFNYFGPLFNGVPASTNSVTLSFDPSRPPPGVDIYMTQGLAITGRVLDARGQPAQGLNVTAYRATFSDGKPLWAPLLSRQIDDRGEYRLSPLPPGEYFAGVTPPQGVPVRAGENPSVRTFFPGVTEPFQATRIILKASDATGTDFSIRTTPSNFFKISGIALNPNPTSLPTGAVDQGFSTFVLMPLETNLIDSFAPNTFSNALPTANRAAGEFEIRNVRPGIYELYPNFAYAGFLSGRTIVDVRSSDALGVQVVINPIVTIEGRVAITSDTPNPVKLNSIRIVLKPLSAPPFRGQGSGGPATVSVSDNGQFTLRGPAGASATLQIGGLPSTAFVSDIRIGNSSIFDRGLEFTSESEPLQVLIDAASGATIDTSVRTADGRPAPRALVVLVPPQDRRQNPMRYKTGTTDNEGRLILRGIPPGSYTALAWESIPETAWLNTEFLSKYQEQGTPVTVGSREQTSLQLKWVPFDADLR